MPDTPLCYLRRVKFYTALLPAIAEYVGLGAAQAA